MLRYPNSLLILLKYSVADFNRSPKGRENMELLHTLNRRLFLMLNAPPDAGSDSLAFALFWAKYMTGAILVLLAGYLLLKHRQQRLLCLNVLLSLLLGMSITYLIRKGCYVQRPFDVQLGTNFLAHSSVSSFPSKHMTVLVSPLMSMCLFAGTRMVGLVGLLAALGVAWSRVYLGVHWPLDMAGSLLVGVMAALSVRFVCSVIHVSKRRLD